MALLHPERLLTDKWGRVASDLRLSLTDRCNLRCSYCMPTESMAWTPQAEILTASEAVRLADIGLRVFGMRDIRFTGGEPLLRKDLETIIAGVRDKHPDVSIALTTNAIGLENRVNSLVAAGLNRINISLDTIREDTFKLLTRRQKLAQVIRGIDAALETGLNPIKINAVMMRGINDRQGPELLQWCLNRGLQLRFIEQMPLDGGHSWQREKLVTAQEIRNQLSEAFTLLPHPKPRGSAPAELWDVISPQSPHEESSQHQRSTTRVLGQVGIIAPVTESFCAQCSRTRITANGNIRTCLFSQAETDLLTPLRAGATDEEIARIWQTAMYEKPRANGSNRVTLNSPSFVQPARSMNSIGG